MACHISAIKKNGKVLPDISSLWWIWYAVSLCLFCFQFLQKFRGWKIWFENLVQPSVLEFLEFLEFSSNLFDLKIYLERGTFSAWFLNCSSMLNCWQNFVHKDSGKPRKSKEKGFFPLQFKETLRQIIKPTSIKIMNSKNLYRLFFVI